MIFYCEPELYDFKIGLNCYCAMFAQMVDMGEDFFDYHSECDKYMENVIGILIKEDILTNEDKEKIMNDSNYHTVEMNAIQNYIDEVYCRDEPDINKASDLHELVECKIYQIYADYMAENHYLEIYHSCFDYTDNYYAPHWTYDLMREWTNMYFKVKENNLLDLIK